MYKLAFLVLIAFFADSIFACSCMSVPKEKHLEYADVVFLGVAQKIGIVDTVEKFDSREFKGTKNEITFFVEEMFKGESKSEFRVYTATSSAACGVNFVEGKSYVVFSRIIKEGSMEGQPVGELGTHSCSMNFEVDKDEVSSNQYVTEKLNFLRISKNKHN